MQELTIRSRLTRRTAGRRPMVPSPPSTTPPHQPADPSRLARMLALAYHVEHLIDRGELRDYTQAARALHVTRARLSQIAALRFLPTGVQEDILLGRVAATERSLRAERARVDVPAQST